MVVLVDLVAGALRPERPDRIGDGHHQAEAPIEHVLTARGQKMCFDLLIAVVDARGWPGRMPINVLIHEIVLEPYGASPTARKQRWSADVEDAASAGTGPSERRRQANEQDGRDQQTSGLVPEIEHT